MLNAVLSTVGIGVSVSSEHRGPSFAADCVDPYVGIARVLHALIILDAVEMTLGYSCMAGRNFSWMSQMKRAGLGKRRGRAMMDVL